MLGGNKNINITSPDSGDNPRTPDYKTKRGPGVGDWLQLGLGLSVMAGVYSFVWFLAINISNFYCWTKYDIACNSTDVIHWVFQFGILLAMILGALFAAQKIYNAGYLFQRGVYLDRAEVSKSTLRLIDVMITSARSEATSGLDTYSPSYQNSSPAKSAPENILDDAAYVAGLLSHPVNDDTIYTPRGVTDVTDIDT